MGRRLDLKHPTRFSEKMQFYKVYYRNIDMLPCTDKYKVREYVKNRMPHKCLLNKLYGKFDKAEDIKFQDLPSQFVIKTTDGGNGENVFICKDKSQLDKSKIIKEVNAWKNKRYFIASREWAYRGATDSKIIIEELLTDPDSKDGSLRDFKFLCFDGKFKYLWVDFDRFSNHVRGWWDENLRFLHIDSDYPSIDTPRELPSNINEMIQVAECLSDGFPFARIDLYNLSGKIVFGEITFYPVSGYVKFRPDSFDYELGKCFRTNYV